MSIAQGMVNPHQRLEDRDDIAGKISVPATEGGL